MTSTNPRMNGKTLRMLQADGPAEISHGDARLMRLACDKWLRERDPQYREPNSFYFGSIRQKKQAA
jgi:hypothetical protein